MNESDAKGAKAGLAGAFAGDPPAGEAAAPAARRSTAARPANAIVRRADIAALSHLAGTQFSLVTPDIASDGAVLRGRYLMAPLRSGLVLHATDACDLHDTTTQVVHGEGITISLFLEGAADISFGGRPFQLGRGGAGAEGVMMARAEPDLFVRRGRRGMRIRKVNVSLPPQWLDGGGLEGSGQADALLELSRHHLASARWRPSARLVALAEQVLAPPVFSPLLSGLFVESRALDIVCESLRAIADSAAGDGAARPQDRQRMWTVHDFIETQLHRDLSLGEIAREAGMSVNSLQRAFRAAFGTTVFEYVRGRKLERAREAMLAEGLTIAQAAYVAGYNSSANFATAFKRAFGVSPKSLRGRSPAATDAAPGAPRRGA